MIWTDLTEIDASYHNEIVARIKESLNIFDQASVDKLQIPEFIVSN